MWLYLCLCLYYSKVIEYVRCRQVPAFVLVRGDLAVSRPMLKQVSAFLFCHHVILQSRVSGETITGRISCRDRIHSGANSIDSQTSPQLRFTPAR